MIRVPILSIAEGSSAKWPTWTMVLAVLLLGPAIEASAQDDWTPGTYMTQAMGRVMGTVRLVDDQSDYGYDGPGTICFMGGYFRPGGTIGFDRSWSKALGTPSSVAAMMTPSTWTSTYNSDGVLVAEDTKADPEPMVQYTPPGRAPIPSMSSSTTPPRPASVRWRCFAMASMCPPIMSSRRRETCSVTA